MVPQAHVKCRGLRRWGKDAHPHTHLLPQQGVIHEKVSIIACQSLKMQECSVFMHLIITLEPFPHWNRLQTRLISPPDPILEPIPQKTES